MMDLSTKIKYDTISIQNGIIEEQHQRIKKQHITIIVIVGLSLIFSLIALIGVA